MPTSMPDLCGHNHLPRVAWGKLQRDIFGHLISEHPLLDHMTDVAACFLALAECTAVRRSLEKTAGRALDAADLQRLAVLVFLHDVGKANAGFQSRRWQLPDRPPGNWPTTPFGHGPEGWELISGRVLNAEHYAAGLPIAEIVAWGEAAVCELLQASISHHGRPLGVSPDKQTEIIWKPVSDKAGAVLYDPAVTLASMGERVKQSYPLAFSECQKPLPDHPAFVHLFAGLVQLADWLGSDARKGFFPYTAPGEGSPARAGIGPLNLPDLRNLKDIDQAPELLAGASSADGALNVMRRALGIQEGETITGATMWLPAAGSGIGAYRPGFRGQGQSCFALLPCTPRGG